MKIRKEFTQTGIPLIDEQHKKFLRTAEELYLHHNPGEFTPQEVKAKLEEMQVYILEHFDAEEFLMLSINYPKLEEHKKVHLQFKELIDRLTVESESTSDTAAFVKYFSNTVISWINENLVDIDNEIAEYIKENNLFDLMNSCTKCKAQFCNRTEDASKISTTCATNEKEIIAESLKEYKQNEEVGKIAFNSAIVESEGYCRDIRLLEIINFARKNNYKKLGLAFCVGLREESEIAEEILKHNEFEVISAACKFSNIDKTELGIDEKDKLEPGSFESICNPVGQAMLFNKEKTDLNILIGLCVGHDSLFFKYSDAPVTVFAVKDRVLGHNPLAAVYTSKSYYKKKLYNT
ncbi:MAG: DUF1847 domain-containing protein [Victivallales bacterium]|nr:DUF1847 domain-containing protein [Victivallales bacterium]